MFAGSQSTIRGAPNGDLRCHSPLSRYANLDTPERGKLKMGKLISPNLSMAQGFGRLGHSNWTIFNYLSQFYFPNFTTFSLSCWEANSYYPRVRKAENGKMDFSQPEYGRGVWVPGAFKLDHLQPFKPILFSKFYNFFTFMLGGQFLLPQREDGWKWENGFHST